MCLEKDTIHLHEIQIHRCQHGYDKRLIVTIRISQLSISLQIHCKLSSQVFDIIEKTSGLKYASKSTMLSLTVS